MDLIFFVATAFFVVVAILYVFACERLGQGRKNELK